MCKLNRFISLLVPIEQNSKNLIPILLFLLGTSASLQQVITPTEPGFLHSDLPSEQSFDECSTDSESLATVVELENMLDIAHKIIDMI